MGTPFSLNYRSDRVPGRRSATSLNIPLSNVNQSRSLRAIELDVTIGGRKVTQAFDGAAGQQTRFVWDGLDAYGRRLQGAQPATITIRHKYPALYGTRADAERRAFGLVPLLFTSVESRENYTYSQTYSVPMGAITDSTGVVGGWTLDVHHRYDPEKEMLYLGDGSRRTATTIGAALHTAGGGGRESLAVGARARDVQLKSVGSLVVAPDGGFVFTHFASSNDDMDSGAPQTSNLPRMIRVNRLGVITAITPISHGDLRSGAGRRGRWLCLLYREHQTRAAALKRAPTTASTSGGSDPAGRRRLLRSLPCPAR